MDFSVVYLVRRLWYRFLDFFHHWYIDGSRAIGRRFLATLTTADRSFAVAITLRHFFEPLYKDYSAIGRILGVVFRSVRVAIGAVCYLILALMFAVVYIIWLAIPAITIFYALKHL
jgi:hypothetical protein